MSLQWFHYFFILFASLFALIIGGFLISQPDQSTSLRGIGLFFLAFGVALVAYGIWFLKKTRSGGGNP